LGYREDSRVIMIQFLTEKREFCLLQNVWGPIASYSMAAGGSFCGRGRGDGEGVKLVTPSSVKVKNESSYTLYLHFPICLHGMFWDRFTAN
jgi:hypothetical protein